MHFSLSAINLHTLYVVSMRSDKDNANQLKHVQKKNKYDHLKQKIVVEKSHI